MTIQPLDTYQQFLANKSKSVAHSGFKIDKSNPILPVELFSFQADIVCWALQLGKAAIFAQCGLGKSIMQLSWAKLVNHQTNQKVLILTPLAVGLQTEREAAKFGIQARFTKDGVTDNNDSIVITNYESLHKFDCSQFIGVVLDESSILKSYSSSTREQIIESFAKTPYKLACTATPSPNDYMELGNHSEFLGVMSRVEMLATYFTHDGGDTSKWRLKGHAKQEFWRWISQWGITIDKPSDLGYPDTGYDLPELKYYDIVVKKHLQPEDGQLFKLQAGDLMERRRARRESIDDRVTEASKLVNESTEQWLIWCDLNDEGDLLEKAIPESVQVAGKHSDSYKESALNLFAEGKHRVLISKPSICGFGMNFQNCHNIVFVGLSDSYESLHQAVRRCWRFGQTESVNVYIITASSEGAVLKNIKSKESKALEMSKLTKQFISTDTETIERTKQTDHQIEKTTTDRYEIYLGDCVEVANQLESDSIDYSIFSPPFSSLYTYSNSDRDMGNCANDDEFYHHFQFLVAELYRVIKPGRLVSFHCMNLPMSKQHDGAIGLKDFRGDLIRAFQSVGFIFHSEVVIWKDPVVAMQRTKALGLLHKQLEKDSAMSRQGIPDYLVTMRKPGTNLDPITGKLDYFVGESDRNFPTTPDKNIDKKISIDIWQRYASPIWTDINPSNTLQKESAREHDDERHIAPLQLDVIERCLQLWSNPDDLVFSPFTGIGSEGFVSVKMNRRFVGSELKKSYYQQACKNLETASNLNNQLSLFA
jgi:DNA modification methylase